MNIKTKIAELLCRTPLQHISVRIKKGLAKGMKWTLLPFSANWREGGEPELEIAVRLHKNLPGATCWDLGSHFGIHTVGLARVVGSTGQVCGFEPDPVAFRRLSRHVAMNQLSWVKLFNAAVSECSGRAEMLVSGGLGSTFTHLRYDDEPVLDNEKKIDIATVVLDELVARGEIREPDLIKVDVQGHGAKALRGAEKSIRKRLPTIIFSCHCQPEADFVAELVRKLDYQCLDSGGKTTDIQNLDPTATYILTSPKKEIKPV